MTRTHSSDKMDMITELRALWKCNSPTLTSNGNALDQMTQQTEIFFSDTLKGAISGE